MLKLFSAKPNYTTEMVLKESVRLSVLSMFKGGHFSVCCVDKAAKSLGVRISRKNQEIYDNLHCVHWSDMSPEFRDVIKQMVITDLTQPPEITP